MRLMYLYLASCLREAEVNADINKIDFSYQIIVYKVASSTACLDFSCLFLLLGSP